MAFDPKETYPEPPEWFVRKIAAMSDPPEETFRQYASFLEGVQRRLDELAKSRTVSKVNALTHIAFAAFSRAGDLLEWAAEGAQQLIAPTQTIPVVRGLGTRVARSTPDLPTGVPSPTDTVISGIRVSSNDVIIYVECFRDPGGPAIQIRVVRNDLTPVRPLTIMVTDEQGSPLQGPFQVEYPAIDPRFLKFPPGVYLFQISWPPSEKRQVRVELR